MRALVVGLLCFVGLVVPSEARAQTGSDLSVVSVAEAGTVYDPSTGNVVRYITGTDAGTLFHEVRNGLGLPLGEVVRAPDLGGAPPVVTDPPTAVSFFDTDGVTPLGGSHFHPVVFDVDATTLGLYTIDALPAGVTRFFTSGDGGQSWTLQGVPTLPLRAGGSGAFSVVTVPNGLHVDGFEVRVYYQTGSGAIRCVRSSIVAVGSDKYFEFDASTSQSVIEPGATSGFTPTGKILPLDGGGFGFVFVPQTDDYIGFAESADGLTGWTVTRGPSDPILSTSANPSAPDPARPEIKEVAVIESAGSWTIFFDGAIPGGPSFDRAVGRLVISTGVGDFVRGDCNLDLVVGLDDAVCSLGFLFQGGTVDCESALDVNDSGAIDLADPVALLGYLFTLGPPPPAPFPDCGQDPTADALDCLQPPICP